jgi:hypothetical protein
VVGFGVVSLSADMVYQGGRSITGPLLASLGASAALVGLVTGAGEAIALVLRVLALPFLVAVVAPPAFTHSASAALTGVLIWGAAMGVQDSTVKALVADLVPATTRATGYGVFAAVHAPASSAARWPEPSTNTSYPSWSGLSAQPS